MNKKNIAIFSSALLVEAIVLAWIATHTASYDDLMILLFPGLLPMAFGGVNIVTILFFVVLTTVLYVIGGLILAFVFTVLQKIVPAKLAFFVVLVAPIFVFSGIMYSQHQKNQEYIRQHTQKTSDSSTESGTAVTIHE